MAVYGPHNAAWRCRHCTYIHKTYSHGSTSTKTLQWAHSSDKVPATPPEASTGVRGVKCISIDVWMDADLLYMEENRLCNSFAVREYESSYLILQM